MSLSLTERQKNELNAAILDYLIQQNDRFPDSINAFRREAGIVGEVETGKGLLEKKWNAVVRLQKRIQDLEAQVQQSKDFSLNGDTNGAGKDGVSGDSRQLPKAPAKFVMEGHRETILAVAAHPMFSLCASGSEDNTIRIWDHETGNYERTLKGHTGYVTGLSFDHRGTFLASCSLDMTAKIWDMTSFLCVKTFRGHEHTISSVKFTPTGDQLITSSRDTTIKLWDTTTGYCIRTFHGHSEWVKCVAVSLDGQYVASGSYDKTIMIWQLSSSTSIQILREHEHYIESLCYGRKPPDPHSSLTLTASAGATNTASSSSTASANAASVATGGEKSSADEFSYLVSGARDRTVKLWDPLKGLLLMSYNAHDNWVRCVLFNPNCKYIISCSDDMSIRVMDIKEGRCMRTINEAHEKFICTMAMSPRYPILISGSVDKKICVWNCF